MKASPLISAPRVATLVAVVCASLTIAPSAMASVIAPPDRADGLGGVNPTLHSVTQMPQTAAAARAFHAHQLGAASVGRKGSVTTPTVFTRPPDRVDGLGSSSFTTVSAPVVAAVNRSNSSFDWTAAVLGAVAGLGIALLAMAAWGTRSRRDVALPSA
jgi:hypothetical protein